MARLFGILGNRSDLAGRALLAERTALKVVVPPTPSRSARRGVGWGVGFHQNGEVLLRRRPSDEQEEIDLAKQLSDLRADVAIGHVRFATVGGLRAENTHPFRYRDWLFAQVGTLDGFDRLRPRLVDSVPEFLRADLRGDTDAELAFHLFLSFLHDQSALAQGIATTKQIAGALRNAFSLIEELLREDGSKPLAVDWLVTNGDSLVGLFSREGAAIRTFTGRADAEAILGEEAAKKVTESVHPRFTLLASEFDEPPPPSWKPVPRGSIVSLERSVDHRIEKI